VVPLPVPDRGFTLVELLTVMAIIATLAALGLTSIPAIIRNSQKTACQSNLQEIHKLLRIYEANNKRLPTASGSSFVLAVWGGQYLDKGVKEAELFFCPSTGRRPGAHPRTSLRKASTSRDPSRPTVSRATR
jgi:prepilin-type N-terminal cleavage/methylation domain-containing protein